MSAFYVRMDKPLVMWLGMIQSENLTKNNIAKPSDWERRCEALEDGFPFRRKSSKKLIPPNSTAKPRSAPIKQERKSAELVIGPIVALTFLCGTSLFCIRRDFLCLAFWANTTAVQSAQRQYVKHGLRLVNHQNMARDRAMPANWSASCPSWSAYSTSILCSYAREWVFGHSSYWNRMINLS